MASPHQSADLGHSNITLWEQGRNRGLTLNTKAINIIWGGDGSKERYWKRTIENSSEVLELQGVYWLEITGKIPLHFLSPSTKYRLFFVLKLTSSATGFDTFPVIFKLHLPTNDKKFKAVELSKYVNGGWVDAPEGGLEFTVPEDNSGMLTFAMYEIECEDWKKGLIIKEVKLVPETNYGTII